MSRRRTPGTHAGFWRQQSDLVAPDPHEARGTLVRAGLPQKDRPTTSLLKDWWLWYASLPDDDKEKFEARARKFRERLGLTGGPE